MQRLLVPLLYPVCAASPHTSTYNGILSFVTSNPIHFEFALCQENSYWIQFTLMQEEGKVCKHDLGVLVANVISE